MVQPGIASQSEVIRAIVLLGERIASQSEVIRAIVSGCSPCEAGSRTGG